METYIPSQEENRSLSNKWKKRWFAMRATYRRSKNVCELLEKEKIECFIPMRYETREIRGKKKRELVPVVQNLMFVYAAPKVIQEIKSKVEYLQYIVNTRSGEKIIVPEEQMRRFIAVAGTYDEQLLWFKPEEVNLAKGTRVRITGGVFEGQEGVFIKVRGARDRRVVVEIQGVIAVAMAAIHPDLIEPLPPEEKDGSDKIEK
ncbi:UpxY family transcription antiterminator [uncultured Parabacteroides sp.]|uniref:UpxY family transcription antiterminator n=1 Tax=uncultured Parabacteroides sp. TaxID=512312 RepID=UPI00262748AC|nr:UpxY family transcription antiterminator [uncultured Parabacteroides sp.]